MSAEGEYPLKHFDDKDWAYAIKGVEEILKDPLQWVIKLLEGAEEFISEGIISNRGTVERAKNDVGRAITLLKLIRKEFNVTLTIKPQL